MPCGEAWRVACRGDADEAYLPTPRGSAPKAPSGKLGGVAHTAAMNIQDPFNGFSVRVGCAFSPTLNGSAEIIHVKIYPLVVSVTSCR